MTMQTLLAEALNLPGEERAQLIERLIESLDGDDDVVESAAWEQAWVAELNRRIEAMQGGKSSTIPAETVFARLRDRIGVEAG